MRACCDHCPIRTRLHSSLYFDLMPTALEHNALELDVVQGVLIQCE